MMAGSIRRRTYRQPPFDSVYGLSLEVLPMAGYDCIHGSLFWFSYGRRTHHEGKEVRAMRGYKGYSFFILLNSPGRPYGR
jgi:hypothetical protein